MIPTLMSVQDCIKGMTAIRRKNNGKMIANWFNNFPHDKVVSAVQSPNAILFWAEDNGVNRVYFGAADVKELGRLFKQVPLHSILEFLTKEEDELKDLCLSCGWRLQVMQLRISSAIKEPLNPISTKENEKPARQHRRPRLSAEEREKALREVLYRPENTVVATAQDSDEIYAKLYEVFDERESHLPTREELLTFIDNKWVVVYREKGELLGFNMKKIEGYKIYGYQIWNGGGPEVYYSLMEKMSEVQWEIIKPEKRPHMVSYAWVNSNNPAALHSAENGGANFDGLRNYIYEKEKKSLSIFDKLFHRETVHKS